MLLEMDESRPSILKELEESPYKFILTGSRRWGNCTNDSDWDFFTDNKGAEEFLTSLGFEILPASYSGDGQCNRVFSYGEPAVLQVQIVDDSSIKLLVQQALLESYPAGFRDKKHAREIWKAAFAGYYVAVDNSLAK